jgi:hypothetical protein
LASVDKQLDSEIAHDATTRSELPYSWEKISVITKRGWFMLEGKVEWNYQRKRAEEAIRRVRGVKGLTNSIQITRRARGTQTQGRRGIAPVAGLNIITVVMKLARSVTRKTELRKKAATQYGLLA